MVVTGDVAFLPAQAGGVPGPVGQKIQLWIECPGALTVEHLCPVENGFALRIPGEEILRLERIRPVCAAVVHRALPGVDALLQRDRVAGTGFDAFAAPVAQRLPERRVGLERRIGHDEDETDERAELRHDDVAGRTGRTESADLRRLGEVDDDVRRRFSRGNRFGVNQFIGVDQLRIGGVIPLDAQIGDVALETGVVPFVFDQSAILSRKISASSSSMYLTPSWV